jgi:lipopolysaccharide heptosyltransferase II
MNSIARWENVRNVLCVRLDAMGDVLMTTPALGAVKEGDARRVTLLTSPSGAEAATLSPNVDDVIVYNAPWMKATAPNERPANDLAMIATLSGRGFDAAVIFTVYSQNPLPSALLCYLAGIPLRLAHCRENPYHLLTEWIPEREPEHLVRHEVRRQLDLVATVGFSSKDERIAIRIPERAKERVASLLRTLELDDTRPWIVVHPGSTAPSRRYPAEGFAEATRRLIRDHGLGVVFTGRDAERDEVERIRRTLPDAKAHSVAGELDLAELTALISRASLVVSNNSGPVHVAAAVGTPVVDLYALTNPQHTPWGVPNRVLNHDVPCKYCYKSVCPEGHHDCLRLVRPEQVVEAVMQLLADDGQRPAPRGLHRDAISCLSAASAGTIL